MRGQAAGDDATGEYCAEDDTCGEVTAVLQVISDGKGDEGSGRPHSGDDKHVVETPGLDFCLWRARGSALLTAYGAAARELQVHATKHTVMSTAANTRTA